jgi:chromosome segregation ATPase
MMVIVMVFLLVAISVILNNYQLVENLKKSIQAQQLASSLAEDTKVENSSLEEQLLQLKQQLMLANTQLLNAKDDAKKTQTALLKNQQIIKELNAISAQQNQQLDEKTAYLAAFEKKSKDQLEQKNTEIANAEIQQQASTKALEETKEKLATQQQKLSEWQQQEEESKKKVLGLQQQLTTLESLSKTRTSEYSELEEKLKKKSAKMAALKAQRQQDEHQLLSLQGELDSLDKKYQKLLRPARSSKGKVVVAVTYTKRKGHSVYRLREASGGDYKKVSRKQLERQLETFKKQHGTALYVKVIIPENSGLSYNEAWKFTNFIQKTYDYYFQEES